METFTNWCLVCERKLAHEATYCSLDCLKSDYKHMITTHSTVRRNSACSTSSQESESALTIDSFGEWSPSTKNKRRNMCPPSPTPSNYSIDSHISATRSVDSNESRSWIVPNESFEVTHSLLAPAFSLEFKSRGSRRL
ncbi:hypothetical protein BDR26DRAFT_918392 [Obelidium mucronatum]|nr:hypothetical protein BDR26DRAFT_918392 [Obelidium mucronatum]